MRGHVDAESLALCAEGLLSRRRSERIRSHMASCPECAAEQARLTEVPALLAQVPPPPLPPGIAARLDAALSAEAARRAAPDRATAPDHPTTAQQPGGSPRSRPAQPRPAQPRPARSRGPWLRLPVAARVLAAAGVLVVAGGVGYTVAHSSASSSSGNAAAPRAPSISAGPDRHPAASTITPGGTSGGAVQFTVRHSGTRYRQHTFAAKAAALLAKPSAGLNGAGKAGGGLSLQAPGSALTGCVDQVAGPAAVRAGEVKLVDRASYEGRPATVIVVRASPAQRGVVYVAGALCSLSDADILVHAPLPAPG